MSEGTPPFEPVPLERWRERVRADLSGRDPEDVLVRRLLDGLAVRPLYTEADRPEDLGWPAAPPFLRGTDDEGWKLVAAAQTPEQSAAARAHGADAVWLPASVAATALHAGELAAFGPGALLVDGSLELALAAGDDVEVLFDPVLSLARPGGLCTSVGRTFRLAADLAAEAGDAVPFQLDGVLLHEAGATAPLELAGVVASGLELLRGLSDAGLPLAVAPKHIRAALALDTEVFVQIAKVRAARLLWSKVLRRAGIDGPPLRIHAFGSRRGLSTLEPELNLLRGTSAAFAAAVAGCDRLTLPAFEGDRALAHRMARNTQHLLRHEGHLHQVLDPGGGSFYLERLTDELARASWDAFRVIEGEGGLVASLRAGALQARVAEAADARAAALATRAFGRVGVNRYGRGDARLGPLPSWQGGVPTVASGESTAPDAVRSHRDGGAGALTRAVRAWAPELPALRQALAVDAEAESVDALTPRRDATPFEEARRGVLALADRRAWVLPVAGRVKARADFAREMLATLGLEVEVRGPVGLDEPSPEDPPPFVCLAAKDDDLPEAVAAFAEPLRAAGARLVLSAGPPQEGADGTVRQGADVLALAALVRGAAS
jgi:methylmalonyl-CoA mutase